jgi:hypothetical protein
MQLHRLHHRNDHDYHIEVFLIYNSYLHIRKNQAFVDMQQQLNTKKKRFIKDRKKISHLENEGQLLFENLMIQQLNYL